MHVSKKQWRKVMANEPVDQKETEKEATNKEYQAKVDALNANRTGIGTRAAYGYTRGKGSMPFIYERFDESQPDTLPKSMQEFVAVAKVTDDASLTKLAVAGLNEKLYTEASDPIAEHVNPSWDDETKTRFRLVVRNYMVGVGASLDDSVALIKPGFEKALAAKK